jgi:transposase
MWNLPKGHKFMRGVSTAKLKAAYKKETSKKAKMRLLVALKRRQGESIDQIAGDLEMGRRTVHSWLRRFVKRGLKGVHDVKQPGRPRRLTEWQLRRLREDLISGPEKFGFRKQLWTTRMVQEHVHRKYGVSYVDRHMRRLLRRLGFSSQKPRPVHYKANEREQERFKKTSPRSWQSTKNVASQ